MATLTKAEQDGYVNGINNLANTAGTATANYCSNLIDLHSVGGKIDWAGLRNDTINAIDSLSSIYGESAKAIADQFFNYCMELQDSKIKAKDYGFDGNKEWIDGKIRYILELAIEGDFDAYLREISSYANFLTWKSGFDQLYKNSTRTDLRYARVPQAGCCAFCLMLASRGFVYHSAESAGEGHEYHPHCKCLVVPSTDKKLNVEDYNPDKYYDMYNEARDKAEQTDYKGGEELRDATLKEMRKMHGLR